MAKYCRYCGNPVSEEAKFCKNCRKPITSVQKQPEEKQVDRNVRSASSRQAAEPVKAAEIIPEQLMDDADHAYDVSRRQEQALF